MEQRTRYQVTSQIQLFDKQFPVVMKQAGDLYLGMSDYSINILDPETLSVKLSIPNAHDKRIQDLVIDELLMTCSSDRTVKLWDTRTARVIKVFQNRDEFFSLAKSKQVVAAGSEGKILFYDLNALSWRSTFDGSQQDEISGLHFQGTNLLSCSTDGLLVQYDLTQLNEEESLQLMIRFEQPLEQCGYWGSKLWARSTTNQISIVDNGNVSHINTTSFDMDADIPPYLLQVDSNVDLSYFVCEGHRITQKNQLQQIKTTLITNQDYVRQITKINSAYLIFGESGIVEILNEQPFVMSMEEEANL